MSILNVQNVEKVFRNYASEWHRIASWFGIPCKPSEETKILDDISFSIGAGEAVGIVGVNGAGKSTLLKIITGTLIPTSGSVSINGRISAILELGMGFNPDLTGRQNVYHSASIMGFGRDAVDEVIDQIEQFAEIGEYFDAPVRTYSSGMQVRVAFAVATAWRPDILIVDEALSVGDSYFQHKSFSRIREFQEHGTTILLVSHDKTAIQSICDRAIFLKDGSVAMEGDPEAVMDYYNAMLADRENYDIQQKTKDDGKVETISGTGEATVSDIQLLDAEGNPIEVVDVGQPVNLKVTVDVHSDIEKLVLGYGIKDRLGQTIFGINTYYTSQVLEDVKAGKSYQFNVYFPANFGQGTYSVQTALVSSETHLANNYEWRDLALIFEVINQTKHTFSGSCWLEQHIEVTELCE